MFWRNPGIDERVEILRSLNKFISPLDRSVHNEYVTGFTRDIEVPSSALRRKGRKQVKSEIYTELERFVSYINQEISAEASNFVISKLQVMRPTSQLSEGDNVFHIIIMVYFNTGWIDSVLKYFDRNISDDFIDEYLAGRVSLEDLEKVSKFEGEVNNFTNRLDADLSHFEEELEIEVFTGLRLSWKSDVIEDFIQRVEFGQIWHRNVNGEDVYYTPQYIDKEGGDIILIGTKDLEDMRIKVAAGDRWFSFGNSDTSFFVFNTGVRRIKRTFGNDYFSEGNTRYTLQNMKLI
jgi:hypothetical protein